MGNNGTTYIPQMSIPTKTGQGAGEQIASGDDGHIQAGFYRGPTRFITVGNLVTDLYTMLQWVKDPSKIIQGDTTAALNTVPAVVIYDQTKAYAAFAQVYINNLTYYIAKVALAAVLTDSNPNIWTWQFTAMPTGHLDAGSNLYWKYSGTSLYFYSNSAMTTLIGTATGFGSWPTWHALPSPLSGYLKTPGSAPANNSTGTLHFINPAAIITLTGNCMNSATDSSGFWSSFGTSWPDNPPMTLRQA